MISRELEELLESLQILSSLPAGPSRTLAQRQRISHIVYDAEYKLILLNQGHLASLSGLSSADTTLSKSYQLAVQTYVLLALRRIKRGSRLVQRYVQALRSDSRNRKLPVKYLSATSNRAWLVLVLWIETVLAIVAIDSEEKLESVVTLRLLLGHIGCIDVEEFIGVLKEVCWLDGYLDDDIFDIWTKAKD